MGKAYGDLAVQAETAVKGVRDKELRKEAFRIILLQMASGRTTATASSGRGPGRPPKKAVFRPGRRGGGVVTTALNKLLAAGYFKTNRDAASVYKDLMKKKVDILPSQLRMELLRFARSGKLKRKVKMKGRKVTYLYRK